MAQPLPKASPYQDCHCTSLLFCLRISAQPSAANLRLRPIRSPHWTIYTIQLANPLSIYDIGTRQSRTHSTELPVSLTAIHPELIQ
ncbi:hypothetical protein IAQ61_008964 [Plenodomus lingam]|uniref:uncharacterized protein n=1 Tax=Leptosphaeria maculans TaxID=5022 RepID=UPI0033250460|nr:hypothetical protein IAQ61_008964 [Plenodomus lingam]